MNNKEIRNKVNELLASGVAKSAVFAQLSSQGAKASRLAYYIASYAPPSLRKEHSTKINILVTLMLVHALLGFFLGVSIGAKIGPEAQWVVGVFVASIPLLFAWGFHKNFVGAYNAYILLTIVQLPRQFSSFQDEPLATSIGLALAIGILVFVWSLRQKIFPDFTFISPIKIKGQYVFSDRPGSQAHGVHTDSAVPVHSLASLDEITGITKSSKKPVKSRLRQKAVYSLVALIVIGSVLYLALPGKVQYALQDAIQRPFAPNFDLLPNKMKSAKQDEWIAEYRNRGYNLQCHGNLRPEEQVSKDDDYICWGIIKSAYGNIPARRVAFWFHKGELQHIKIQFPENSFAPLQGFLGKHFEGVKRLDQLPNSQLGKSAKDKSLMMWSTEHGFVVASNSPPPGQPFILGWISKEKMTRDIVAELQSQIQANAKSTSQTSNSIGTPPAAPSAALPSTQVSAASMPAPAQALQASPAQSAVAGQASATTARLGPNNTLVTVNTLAPNITNIEAEGNLESTNNIGCVGPDKLSRKYTSADLYKAAAACIQQGMNKESIFLGALAGTYGYFDTLRVADKTAHDAPLVLRMTTLEAIDEKKKTTFFIKTKGIYSDPQAMSEICKDIIRIGPPDYFPRYMIQHGIKVLTDAKAGNGLVEGFDANAAWSQTLGKYLHCAGYETQKQPAKNNGPDTTPVQTFRPAPAHNIVVADAKAFQPKRRKPSDLRYCLDLPDNYAIAKCAEQ